MPVNNGSNFATEIDTPPLHTTTQDAVNEAALWEHDSELSDPESTTSHMSTTYDYSLEDAITYLGLGKFQFLVMVLAGMVWFAAAIQLMSTSLLILNLRMEENSITRYETGTLASMPFLGEIFGAFFISMFSDKYGRKKSILVAALCLSFFGTLSAVSYDFYMLMLCRLMTGCAVGGSLTCLSLVTEFVPQKHRGELTYVESSLWSFGALYAIGIGWLIYASGLDWRWYLASCAAPSWIAVICVFFIPESPRWMLNNGENAKVKQQLMRIARWNGVDMSMLRGSLMPHVAVDENKKGAVRSLFIAQYLRTSAQVLVMTFCTTCAYFGVALFQLTYFESMSTSDSQHDVFWELLVCTAAEIPGMIVGILIFDHVGRIPFMTTTFVTAMLCFIGLVFSPQYVGVALIFLARMCIACAYNILIVYILEYYPTTIRATALGFCITLARFAGVGASFITQDLSAASASIIFSVCCAVSAVDAFLLKTETLGRALADDSDEGIAELVNGVLSEYDQSTIPLMQHKPHRNIRRHIEKHMTYNIHDAIETCMPECSPPLSTHSAFF
eukprot:CAMPEP_0202688458 /NCGR_PEP_ID=MMETSP1385-20130828/3971_1 /ASSEMBLY_ACC=CAM_ASM_000861 /TAXON_ID=933848 /ORGANISM="Elphidium margaritaceum" /LENGTH=557 /DNA_ID=CAMNT_0049343445 /DNA_START=27 /DNA_END=1700 /DNA_ORIENTATION=-